MKNPSVPEPLNDDELQETVVRDFGWQFEGPFYKEAPVPLAQYVGYYTQEVERLRNHILTTVIIRDQFDQDHSARRAFLTKQGLSGFVKRKNKLKGNNLLSAVLSMDMVMNSLKRGYPDKYQELSNILTREITDPVNPPNYNASTFDQKVVAARKLDDAIYRFLAVLAQ